MFVKKNINKNHPLYEKYVSECKNLFQGYEAKIETERAKYPNWKRLDHPASTEIRALERECNSKLGELQREYDFLFSKASDDE